MAIKYEAPTNRSTGISAATLNAAARLLSSEIDNETNLDTFLALELTWTCSTASTVNESIVVRILYAIDGTVYEDGDASTDSFKMPVGSFLDDGGTGAQIQTIANIPIRPFKFKIHLRSRLTNNATSVTLDAETYNLVSS